MKKTESMQKNILGTNIKEHRRLLKMTQEFLAEKLDVSRQAISKWECGETEPSTANLISLATLFNVSVDELVMPCEIEENKANKANNRLSLLIKRHKLLTALTAILLCLAITVCALAICDIHYYSSIFYVTQEQMNEFIENGEGINEYEIPPYPSLRDETDPFVLACCNQYFATTSIEHTRITDALFQDKNERYLILCFDTDENYPAKEAFYDLSLGNKTAKFKRPFLSFFKSSYAERYYKDKTNQPFMQYWFKGNKLVIMISENKESALQMMNKILAFQKL